MVRGSVGHEGIQFDEGALVHQHGDALARSASTGGANGLELSCSSTFFDGATSVAEFAEPRTVDALHGVCLLNAVLDVLAGQSLGGFSPQRSR